MRHLGFYAQVQQVTVPVGGGGGLQQVQKLLSLSRDMVRVWITDQPGVLKLC